MNDTAWDYFPHDHARSRSYMKYLYKYPHRAFPYSQLVEENRKRGRLGPEFELLDTGLFDEDCKGNEPAREIRLRLPVPSVLKVQAKSPRRK
ncbi:MAG: hypothetical protein HY548_08990 [Elusimicrobia bacterium]|nr:hypothetical protein [Elusimicrobiota bacterium]